MTPLTVTDTQWHDTGDQPKKEIMHMTHLNAVLQRAIRESVEDTLCKLVVESTTKGLMDLLTTSPALQQKLSAYLERELEQALNELTTEKGGTHDGNA